MRLSMIQASRLGWQQRVAGFMRRGNGAIAQDNREPHYSIVQGKTVFGPPLDKSTEAMVPDRWTTVSIIGAPEEKVAGDPTNGADPLLKTLASESLHLAAAVGGFPRFNILEYADY